MQKIISIIFLCASINALVAMELQKDKQTVNLKLVDDKNKNYTIARWKVIQETSQADVLDIPGLTEKEISKFDKESDEFDLNRIQGNNLTQDIKKNIMLHELIKKHHLPAYKVIFDYLLTSMIADNIRNNRVKTEKPYPFKTKLVQKLLMGNLHIPPIDKLANNTFIGRLSLLGDDFPDEVRITMPLSTMVCTSSDIQNGSCVNICNKLSNDPLSESVGVVHYDQKNITGLGFTNDLRYLVTTFDNNMVSKAELYSNSDLTAYKLLMGSIKLADIYLLSHLYKAKQQKTRVELHDNEREYVRDHVAQSEKGKELLQKHFLS